MSTAQENRNGNHMNPQPLPLAPSHNDSNSDNDRNSISQGVPSMAASQAVNGANGDKGSKGDKGASAPELLPEADDGPLDPTLDLPDDSSLVPGGGDMLVADTPATGIEADARPPVDQDLLESAFTSAFGPGSLLDLSRPNHLTSSFPGRDAPTQPPSAPSSQPPPAPAPPPPPPQQMQQQQPQQMQQQTFTPPTFQDHQDDLDTDNFDNMEFPDAGDILQPEAPSTQQWSPAPPGGTRAIQAPTSNTSGAAHIIGPIAGVVGAVMLVVASVGLIHLRRRRRRGSASSSSLLPRRPTLSGKQSSSMPEMQPISTSSLLDVAQFDVEVGAGRSPLSPNAPAAAVSPPSAAHTLHPPPTHHHARSPLDAYIDGAEDARPGMDMQYSLASIQAGDSLMTVDSETGRLLMTGYSETGSLMTVESETEIGDDVDPVTMDQAHTSSSSLGGNIFAQNAARRRQHESTMSGLSEFSKMF
ncbi:MAG: hypothetical protein SGCHY_002435 [Lobulomycetales sp.]